MPEHRRLEPAAPWVELVATEDDWDAADPDLLPHDARPAGAGSAPSRSTSSSSPAPGLIHGPAHSSIGQEGGAVGSVLALTSEDSVNGSHRGHHQFLAKALHHVEPKGVDPLAEPTDEVREVLLRTLAEICGLDRGWSHGRGGSMHLQWKEAGAMGTNAIVGGGVPHGGRLRLGAPAGRHRRGLGDLLRRRRGQHRLDAGDLQPGRGLEAAGLLLHREQPVRRVHHRCEEATGEPRLSARGPGLRHRELEGRRDGPAGRPPRDARGGRAHARRQRADDRRGRHLPLLPPERRLPRQRVRLPRQGRGARSGASATRSPRSPATSCGAG